MKGIKKLILLACITVGILSSFVLVSAKEGQVAFKDVHLKFDTWKGTGNASISLGDDFLTKDLNVVEAINKAKEIATRLNAFNHININFS